MIPFRDNNPSRTFPFFTLMLIAGNIGVFVFSMFVGIPSMAKVFGAVPASLLSFSTIQPIGPVTSIFTSMFLHAGFLHLAGNMLYMWIFADNIEDKMGHIGFLIFYLTGGAVAAYSHALFSHHSTVPMVGASGAISAVLGAYIYLFPRARIDTLVFFGFFFQVIQIPALIVIGFWAIIQIVSGLLDSSAGGGVAWFAHVGGFLYGLIVVRILLPKRRRAE